ncbi:transcription antitermination factor NusB [Thermus thermamylovorans]|uniref:Transcription antitermination protein NusB n=1 Tax=Thermus thermamylovorans TaxID=2509362 RepID=A0A4Q9B8E1_9DEIN|nr:transcription antitermination factor NusB [Thermus thermamylovorans]TBH21896.1 transcription antitermination factor NusB [Thermus thermamylovorans]
MLRRARELAMRALFAHTQGGVGLEEAFRHALEEMGEEEDAYSDPLDEEGVAFARRLLQGYQARAEEVDRVLAGTVEGWDFAQMSKTDLTVLRLAVYEMLYEPTPFAPLIEVAVKIANRYGGEHSGAFVNGVLGRLYRRIQEGELAAAPKEG